MIVEGVEVQQEALDKCAVWACTQLHFTYAQLQAYMSRCRVTQEVVYRAADRLLQQWKKQGKIMYRKGQWHWQTSQ